MQTGMVAESLPLVPQAAERGLGLAWASKASEPTPSGTLSNMATPPYPFNSLSLSLAFNSESVGDILSMNQHIVFVLR